jgi:hypothetical protein
VIDGSEPPKVTRDTGLRRVLMWTLVALVVSIMMAVVGVSLVTHWFDRP